MSKFSKEEILYIAKLSRLELTDEEICTYGEQLSCVLDYFDELQKVDISSVSDCSNATGLSNVEREDEIKPSGIKHNDIEKNAPKFENGYFVVPGVFE